MTLVPIPYGTNIVLLATPETPRTLTAQTEPLKFSPMPFWVPKWLGPVSYESVRYRDDCVQTTARLTNNDYREYGDYGSSGTIFPGKKATITRPVLVSEGSGSGQASSVDVV
jgi:hypothetical protein